MKLNTSHRSKIFILAVGALIALAGCSNSAPAPEVDTGIAAENLEKGKAFLEANASKEGVVTIDGGVQYKVITSNPEGRTPKLTDDVNIHLRMSHIDGTVINDSFGSDEPVKVYVKHAIAGWRKTLTKMTVGSRWIVYIPPHMAFSTRGNDGVGPNETLICEIELLDIVW
ncbi:FKBP-type peptidyl-prolyl cis-trans isomerase FklB [Mariprofundus ferrinatatus]|uniref:Peptidyl-prolyl cis-trans isomerase n=1 Tax=Mariprofundus ferrinatatus TaxID=1921087 RepID=A0A2K8LBD3_9PROT|nr:FKBP-type peptidyl-prolyl cis-trans isomerase [Mariprofundus ferrinatatus]ATX81546.1 FKBP-type peptidyl-prolyl cis-trans isomerase FklB [Mariprofundus ferrinatatus]